MKQTFETPYEGWPELSDFYIMFSAAGISYVANFLVNKLSYDFFYRNCREKHDESLRVAKATKAAYSFYKGIYFICVTIWGHFIFRDEIYFPPSLLGSGELRRINEGFPTYRWPEGLKYYYLGTMGYNLHQLFYHTFAKARNDFAEMMVHHTSTILLYGFSYYLRRTTAGGIVMHLHDWADIPTQFVRTFTETEYTTPSIISAILMTISWFYTRLIVYP
jgi:ceramide synthetase